MKKKKWILTAMWNNVLEILNHILRLVVDILEIAVRKNNNRTMDDFSMVYLVILLLKSVVSSIGIAIVP